MKRPTLVSRRYGRWGGVGGARGGNEAKNGKQQEEKLGVCGFYGGQQSLESCLYITSIFFFLYIHIHTIE